MNDKETIYNRILESFNKQTFMGLIGAKLEYVEYGKVSVSCENRKDLSQQHGFLHGGVIMSIADICGGYAALSVLPKNCEVVTVELKISLLRPVTSDKIIGVGTVIKAGKNLIVVDATINDRENKIVAKMLATMYKTK